MKRILRKIAVFFGGGYRSKNHSTGVGEGEEEPALVTLDLSCVSREGET